MNWERYKELDDVLQWARRVCPPDEYQHRLNNLTYAMAAFLLKPYHEFIKEQNKEE